ncbi:MAG: hypothetical protein JRJ59_08930, partial [Deltaproteobacteria bacterium]|nr:hypothetical protein [Deltaproteobacteria bacterium]
AGPASEPPPDRPAVQTQAPTWPAEFRSAGEGPGVKAEIEPPSARPTVQVQAGPLLAALEAAKKELGPRPGGKTETGQPTARIELPPWPVRLKPPSSTDQPERGQVRAAAGRPAVEPDKLVAILARFKGAFLKETLEVVDRAQSQVPKVSSRTARPRVRADLAKTIRTFWPRLATAISSSQGQTQAVINDLEQAFNQIIVRLGLTGQRQAQTALGQVEEALRGLEAVQVLNAAAAETQTSFVLPLPFAPGWGLTAGQVYFFEPPARSPDQEGDRPLRLVFLLEMSRLGPVRVDVSLVKKELRLNLYLTGEKAAAWANERLDALTRGLTELGYQVRAAKAKPFRTAPPVESLAPPPAPPGHKGLIDLKA